MIQLSNLFIMIFLVCVLFLLMFLIDNKIWFYKLKKYFLNCSELEKEILKTFIQKPDIAHPLNDIHQITYNLKKLFIIIKKKDFNYDVNSKQSFYYINKKIFVLIKNDKLLKDIYLL